MLMWFSGMLPAKNSSWRLVWLQIQGAGLAAAGDRGRWYRGRAAWAGAPSAL